MKYRALEAKVSHLSLKKLADKYILSYNHPADTKHLCSICTMLDQRRRRWADVVQMLYKCFVFAWYMYANCWNALFIADTMLPTQ